MNDPPRQSTALSYRDPLFGQRAYDSYAPFPETLLAPFESRRIVVAVKVAFRLIHLCLSHSVAHDVLVFKLGIGERTIIEGGDMPGEAFCELRRKLALPLSASFTEIDTMLWFDVRNACDHELYVRGFFRGLGLTG